MAASREGNKVKTWAPYQWEILVAPWFEGPLGPDRAQVDTIEKARRIGGSEVAAMKAVLFMLGRELRPDLAPADCDNPFGWTVHQHPMSGVVISKDLATGKDFIGKIAKNLADMAAAGDAECAGAIVWATKITLPSTGVTVRALAATGTTIRGWDGFVVLDEFAHHRDPEAVWAAIIPICMPNWGNPRGTPLIIISSPWDSDSLPYRVFTSDAYKYRRWQIDIYRAIADGFPITVEDAKVQCFIPEVFATEYECKWSHGGGSFFPVKMLNNARREDLVFIKQVDTGTLDKDGRPGEISEISSDTCGLPPGWQRCPRFYGIDVGGGVGRDFTAIIQFHVIDGEYWITGVKAFNNLKFDEQCDLIAKWVRKYPGEVKVDRGLGGGQQMLQRLQTLLGGAKGCSVSGAGMSGADQELVAGRMRNLLDSQLLRIYEGGESAASREENAGRNQKDQQRYTETGGDLEGPRALILELSMMKAMQTGGKLKIETPRDELKGHCDRAWACLIALHCGTARNMMPGSNAGQNVYRPKNYVATNPDLEPIGFGIVAWVIDKVKKLFARPRKISGFDYRVKVEYWTT
jgi:hypothetical protein